MEKKKINLKQLFDEQSKKINLVTIEKIEENENHVKITPWEKDIGCLCELAIEIPTKSIKEIYQTEYKHQCCNKILLVVEIILDKDFKIPVFSIFNQQLDKFNERKKSLIKRHHQDIKKDDFGNHHYSFELHNDDEYYSGESECPQGSYPVLCGGRRLCIAYGSRGNCCGGRWCEFDCRYCGGRNICVSGRGTCCGGRWCPGVCRNGRCYWN